MKNKILLERRLTTDFTMGFELEAIWCGEDSYDYIEEFFDENFMAGGDVHEDGSLEPDHYNEEPFEYASPVLPVNLTTFNKIINFFNEHYGNDFYVNNSCGFHHHISFNGMTDADICWIMSNIALDNNIRKSLSKFKNYNFVSEWSGDDYLDDIKLAVREGDFDKLYRLCSTDKYSLINVHSDINTLEWRGPRGFLEEGDKNTIIDFYKRLFYVVDWIVGVMDYTELPDGTSKKNFYDAIKVIEPFGKLTSFEREKEYKKRGEITDEDIIRLADKAKSSNGDLLIKISKNTALLDKVIQKVFNKSGLAKVLNSLVARYNNNNVRLKKIIKIAFKYIPLTVATSYLDMLDVEDINKIYDKQARRFWLSKYVGSTGSKSDYNTYVSALSNMYEKFGRLPAILFLNNSSDESAKTRMNSMLNEIISNETFDLLVSDFAKDTFITPESHNKILNKLISALDNDYDLNVSLFKDIVMTYLNETEIKLLADKMNVQNTIKYLDVIQRFINFDKNKIKQIIYFSLKRNDMETLDKLENYDIITPSEFAYYKSKFGEIVDVINSDYEDINLDD